LSQITFTESVPDQSEHEAEQQKNIELCNNNNSKKCLADNNCRACGLWFRHSWIELITSEKSFCAQAIQMVYDN